LEGHDIKIIDIGTMTLRTCTKQNLCGQNIHGSAKDDDFYRE
jgi:hypothetical protein